MTTNNLPFSVHKLMNESGAAKDDITHTLIKVTRRIKDGIVYITAELGPYKYQFAGYLDDKFSDLGEEYESYENIVITNAIRHVLEMRKQKG